MSHRQTIKQTETDRQAEKGASFPFICLSFFPFIDILYSILYLESTFVYLVISFSFTRSGSNVGQSPNVGQGLNIGHGLNVGQGLNIGHGLNVGQGPDALDLV